MDSLPDTVASILDGMRAQDQEAWKRFDGIYREPIVGRCKSFGLADADAQDVTQEIMLKLHNNLRQYDAARAEGRFRPWLATLIKNAVIDWQRKRQRERVVAPAGDSNVQALLDVLPALSEGLVTTIEPGLAFLRDRNLRLGQAINRTRERAGESTWLAFYQTAIEEKSAAEVAAALGMTQAAVYKARSRVLLSIQKELAGIPEAPVPEVPA